MLATVVKALSIAGSDSGGCAGIQADLKTFAALGVHGMSVITAITAQNTLGVTGVEDVSPGMIGRQLEAVLTDIGAEAVKSGMIPGPAAMRIVADGLKKFHIRKFVLDPVMVSTSGARLMRPGVESVLCRYLLPQALLATPNRQEAEILARRPVRNQNQLKEAARVIHDLGPAHVLIKGGHFSGAATDLLFDGRSFHVFSSPRIRTRNLHGAGCTLAAAITACLAKDLELLDAVAEAKRYVSQAIAHSLDVGKGPGPLGHFYAFWPR